MPSLARRPAAGPGTGVGPCSVGRRWLFIAAGLAGLAWPAACAAAGGSSRPPDIIVLVTDDQRADCLSCYGHRRLMTPQIDRLAAEGIRFENAFVTTAICCVSRASLFTGLLARHHQVGDFATPLASELLAQTYPAVLRRLGYRTCCLGKWGIGGPDPLEAFDVFQATGGQGEFFETVDGEPVHNSELLARRAVAFLDGLAPEVPCCLVVNYKSPHEPFLPDPLDAPLFRDDTFEVPRTYDEAHFAALPDFIRQSEGRRRLLRRHPTPEAYQEFVRQYLRCLAGVDRSVGKILSALARLDRDAGAWIVFTSDHGFLLGEHGLSGKWLMYEESIRVPLLIRPPRGWSGPRGQVRRELALNVDLAPTLLEAAGAAAPHCDGQSLLPLCRGESVAWRDAFFYEHHFHNGGTIPRTEGLRTKDWKYVTYFDVAPPYEQLFDLAADPLEERNLAGDPAAAAKLAELRSRYRTLRDALPEPVLPASRPARTRP